MTDYLAAPTDSTELTLETLQALTYGGKLLFPWDFVLNGEYPITFSQKGEKYHRALGKMLSYIQNEHFSEVRIAINLLLATSQRPEAFDQIIAHKQNNEIDNFIYYLRALWEALCLQEVSPTPVYEREVSSYRGLKGAAYEVVSLLEMTLHDNWTEIVARFTHVQKLLKINLIALLSAPSVVLNEHEVERIEDLLNSNECNFLLLESLNRAASLFIEVCAKYHIEAASVNEYSIYSIMYWLRTETARFLGRKPRSGLES